MTPASSSAGDSLRPIADVAAREFGFAPEVILRPACIARLEARLDELGINPVEYAQRLRFHPEARAEKGRLFEILANHETYFGREVAQLRALVRAGVRGAAPRALSAGCSTGEEAFTLASLLLEAGAPGASVLGWDASEPCITRAREARFASTGWRTPVATALPGIREAIDGWTIDPALRQMVSFAVRNLISPASAVDGTFDLIVCRNVLLYLGPAAVEQVLTHLAAVLSRDGLLCVGHAESILLRHPALEPRFIDEHLFFGRRAR